MANNGHYFSPNTWIGLFGVASTAVGAIYQLGKSLATKEEVQESRAEFKEDIKVAKIELKKDIKETKVELKEEIKETRTDLKELSNRVQDTGEEQSKGIGQVLEHLKKLTQNSSQSD